MTNWMDNKHFCNSLLVHTPVFSGKNDQSIHRGQRSQLASAKSGEAESENGLYSLRKKKKKDYGNVYVGKLTVSGWNGVPYFQTIHVVETSNNLIHTHIHLNTSSCVSNLTYLSIATVSGRACACIARGLT